MSCIASYKEEVLSLLAIPLIRSTTHRPKEQATRIGLESESCHRGTHTHTHNNQSSILLIKVSLAMLSGNSQLITRQQKP